MRETGDKMALDFKIFMRGVDVDLDKTECAEVVQAVKESNLGMMAACWGLSRAEARQLVIRSLGVTNHE